MPKQRKTKKNKEKQRKQRKTKKNKAGGGIFENIATKITNSYNDINESLKLRTICSDSNVCIAFGNENERINDYFGNFVDFNYVNNLQTIGSSSVNGVIYEINYRRNFYNAYTVLKIPQNARSDNLCYEYLVGKFINTKIKYYPCFLETYQLYYKNDYIDSPKKLKNNLIKINEDEIINNCLNNDNLALLIQHIKSAISLYNFLDSNNNDLENLANILYQIYFPLSMMASEFTHNDLHLGNILLYTPVKGKYIHYYYYHYDINNQEQIVEFYSPYIVKIIDYGRCYFNNPLNENDNSIFYFNEIIALKKQTRYKDFINNYGFSNLIDEKKNRSILINNQTIDLRILYHINEYMKVSYNRNKYKVTEIMRKFLNLNKYKYNKYNYFSDDSDDFIHNILDQGYPNSINNVKDAEKGLRNILMNDNYYKELLKTQHNIYKSKIIGDLHIYAGNKDMVFAKNN